MIEVTREECIAKFLEIARKKGMKLPKGIEMSIGNMMGEYYDFLLEAGFKIMREAIA